MTTQKMVYEKQINDPDFGDLTYHISNKDRILWSFTATLFDSPIIVYIQGGAKKLNPELKKIFLDVLANEESLKKEITKALQIFKIDDNTSFNDQLKITEISIWSKNYDITLLDTVEKKSYIINLEDLKIQDINIE